MDFLLKLLMGYSLVSSGRVAALYDYVTTSDVVTWDKANDSCYTQHSPNHHILDWRNTTDQSSALLTLLTDNDIYWTRGYYLKTDFYWKLGCYDTGGEKLSIVTDFKQENSLFKCSTHCERKDFIGLEGTKCHCFAKRPTLGSQSDKTCSNTCPGNRDDTCGDVDKMTIYRALSFTEDGVSGTGQSGDCFAINKEDLSSYDDVDFEIFTSHSCLEQKSFICESKEANPETMEIYTKYYEKKTFFEADRICSSKGDRLAFIVKTNVFGVLNYETPDGSSYWIGLYRQVYRGTVDNGHFNETPYMCEGVRKSGDNLEIIEEHCNATRKAVCQIDIEPSTTFIPHPTTDHPTTHQETTTTEPTTEYPTTQQIPTTSVPTTAEPTIEPTTQEQTTLVPTPQAVIVTSEKPETTSTELTKPPVPPEMATTEGLNAIGDVGKNVADREDEDDHEESPSWLVILLIILAVIFIIILILVGFAYRKYRKNKRYQKVSLVDIQNGYTNHGANPDNVMIVNASKPTPQKPARQNSTKLNDQVNKGEPSLQPQQNGLSVPETRDDISWNLPFIDASRNTLDNIDESQPVMVRKSVLLSNSESVVDGKEIDAGAEAEEEDVFQDKSDREAHGSADGDSKTQSIPEESQPLNQSENRNSHLQSTSSQSSVEI